MPVRSFVYASVVAICGLAPCLAQQPTGPATLENLLTDEGAAPAQRPAAVDTITPTAAIGLPSGRIQGVVARPKDGVQHPDLDRAWVDYDAQIETVAKAVEDAIKRALNAAAAAGDLDGSLKWKAAGEKFQKDGKIPEELDGGKAEGKPKAKPPKPEASPQSEIAGAEKQLATAYEAVEKTLTTKHDFEGAKLVRAERGSLFLERHVNAPPEPGFNAGDPVVGRWRWWVNGGEVAGHVFERDGRIQDAPDSSWMLVDPAARRYQFVWGKRFLDVMVLSPDGKTLQGRNSEGALIKGQRIK